MDQSLLHLYRSVCMLGLSQEWGNHVNGFSEADFIQYFSKQRATFNYIRCIKYLDLHQKKKSSHQFTCEFPATICHNDCVRNHSTYSAIHWVFAIL